MKKFITRKGIAANGSVVSTSVLVYMALHDDDVLQFGCKRLNRITDWVVQKSKSINRDMSKLQECREQIVRHGLDYQLQQDFIRALLKGLKYTGKEEYAGAREGADAAYILIFLALHELYGFGPQRLQRVQQRIKHYAWFIRDGVTHVLEYMKCLKLECGQQYAALDAYEKQHGEIQI
jgi:hypothetical protein